MTDHVATGDAEGAALDAFSLDALLEFVLRLVAVPSIAEADAHHRAGERESQAQRLVERTMREIGLTTDLWNIDLGDLRQHPAYSTEIERDEALGLVGVLGGAKAATSKVLVLNGHVDVVPASDPERWTSPPFRPEIRDGHVFGRGALDMKGGLGCGLFALDAINRAGVRLAGKVLVHSVVGEEDGGLGTLAAIERGYVGDAAVVLEPTGLDIVCAHAGCANFRLTVRGRSAHGCHRDEGVSAVEKFAVVHQSLLDFERDYNQRHAHPLLAHLAKPYPLSVGRVRAGDWPSSVPETLVAEGRFGVAVDSDLEHGRRDFQEALERANASDPWLRENPARVEWWGGQFEPAVISTEEEIVRVLAEARAFASGEPARRVGVPYGADMRLLVLQGGMPTVLFGPGDVRRAHAPDESVPIEQLAKATETLIRTVIGYLGVA